jgi:hypothetical protein
MMIRDLKEVGTNNDLPSVQNHRPIPTRLTHRTANATLRLHLLLQIKMTR